MKAQSIYNEIKPINSFIIYISPDIRVVRKHPKIGQFNFGFFNLLKYYIFFTKILLFYKFSHVLQYSA